MKNYFPPIEPYEDGFLDGGAGHKIYWAASGTPGGVPALILHGGPGSGSSSGQRRMWDPRRYQIIQMDQRNCGRSTPPASDPDVSLDGNTTTDLIADIEQLRQHLGIDRWVLWGGSWGTTLALAYAEKHPEHVRALVLVFMMLARRSDLRWLYQEMGRYFPEEWATFRAGAGDGNEDDLLGAYHRMLNESHDAGTQRTAALNWCAWENIISSLDPGWKPTPSYDNIDFCLQFSRITAHYFSHDAFLEPGQILRDAYRLAGIPGEIIHGREDRANPYDMAWQLAQKWPNADLRTLPGVGHTPTSPAAAEAVLSAIERFADLP